MSVGMATATSCRAAVSAGLAKSALTPSQKTGSPSPSLSLPLRSLSSRVRAEVGTSTSASSSSADPAAGKKVPPLARGGTLSGKEAAGKDPAPATLGAPPKVALTAVEKFQDARWVSGTWDLAQFTKDGTVDWDAVIDAEVVRRQWLEENPQSSNNDDKVLFDTSTIPWWAWVRRFHLPEAEKLNGRAAMVGFFMGYVVDAATGVGLVDQTGSFFGKLLLLLSVVGVLLVRRNEDVSTLKNLFEESTFYDRQWQAAWKEGPPRPGSEEKK